MSKYDKMITLNKKTSEEKINKAVGAIHKMLEEGEKVTVPKLINKTGLSRGFFYKNLIVRREVDRALEQQVGMIDPKRYIGDMVLKRRIELLEQQMKELQREKEELIKKNRKLEQALNRKDLTMIKNL
ncbi:DUF6262 family protein [Hespellia stercorisuis]|uniref:Transposase n=1 Tax=Hespellia stercorisuis DSM 15480 TaxID=1121950 RepID=A0A1M6IA51_9FIRM|nr:DUF6262 family protein [Hespellia stercorisuis]SHJ31282.1 hypothetical protein SAMN02745243_00291 [Hespellia stercorisuis DSM 15480]